MCHLSDRQLVERLVLPGMMQAILRGVSDGIGEDGAALNPVMNLLGDALREPLADCHDGKHGKLARRAARVATMAMAMSSLGPFERSLELFKNHRLHEF